MKREDPRAGESKTIVDCAVPVRLTSYYRPYCLNDEEKRYGGALILSI